jgi:hypothetical protein
VGGLALAVMIGRGQCGEQRFYKGALHYRRVGCVNNLIVSG